MGRWIGGRLNEMEGPVRFFLPEGGVSALDAPGQPFHDPGRGARCSTRWRRPCARPQPPADPHAAPHQRPRIRRMPW
jgi:hypothetical protein